VGPWSFLSPWGLKVGKVGRSKGDEKNERKDRKKELVRKTTKGGEGKVSGIIK